jgi:hypothetical protein
MYLVYHRLYTTPGYFYRQYIDQRITTQETLLQRIAQELGLDKPK